MKIKRILAASMAALLIIHPITADVLAAASSFTGQEGQGTQGRTGRATSSSADEGEEKEKRPSKATPSDGDMLILDEDDLGVDWIVTGFDAPEKTTYTAAAGTVREDLGLPDTLMAYLEDAADDEITSERELPVTWIGYDSQKAGKQKLTAELEPIYGLASGVTPPELSVETKWQITGYLEPDELETPFGTEESELELPAQVKASVKNSAEYFEVPVVWDCVDGYNALQEGVYLFYGEPHPGEELEEASGAGQPVSPVQRVTVLEQEQYSVSGRIGWNPISGHDKPEEADLKQAIEDGLSNQEAAVGWDADLAVSCTENSAGGWDYEIEGLPAQMGAQQYTYELEPVLADFLFSPARILIEETTDAADFNCKPVLKPTLQIQNTYYGGGNTDSITYSVTYQGGNQDGSQTDVTVLAGETKQLPLPAGVTGAVVKVRTGEFYTWSDPSVTADFSEEKPVFTAEFFHSVLKDPVTATINWNDNRSTGTRPAPDDFLQVEATVGQTVLDPVPDYQMDAETVLSFNTWTLKYSGLPAYDGAGSLITYQLQAPEHGGYLKNVKTSGLDGYYVQYTLKADFTVQILWKDNGNLYETRPAQIAADHFQLQLAGSTADAAKYPHTITVSNDVLDITGLPAYDDDGHSMLWSLVQESFPVPVSNTVNEYKAAVYHASYQNVGNLALELKAVYHGGTIYNLLSQNFDYKASALWQDVQGTLDRPDAKLTLQRYIYGLGNCQNAYPIPGGTGNRDLSKESGSLDITFSGLPCFDEQGREYIYFVSETLGKIKDSADSYEKVFQNDQRFTGLEGGLVHTRYLFPGGNLINRRTGTVTREVTVTWNTAARQSMVSEVLLQAQSRQGSGETWTDVEGTGTNSSGVATGSVRLGKFFAEQTSLTQKFSWPKYDDSGLPLEYQVVETKVYIEGENPDGYELVSGGFTDALGYEYRVAVNHGEDETEIVHTLNGSHTLVIRKKWLNPDPDTDTLTFQILRDGAVYEYMGQPVVTMNHSVSGEYWGELAISGLDAYDADGRAYLYDVRETPVPANHYVSYSYPAGSNPMKTEITVTNNPAGGTASHTITVKKEWKDDGDTSSRLPVRIEVWRRGTGGGEDQFVNAALLTSENNWWSYLTVTGWGKDDSMRNYYVRESEVGGSAITYSDANPLAGTVTTGKEGYTYQVSNTPTVDKLNTYTSVNKRIGSVSISVDASVWVDGEKADENRPPLVIELYRDGSFTGESVTLTGGADGWKHIFEDLEKYDPQGKIYSYTLKAGYDPGYAEEDKKDYQMNQTGYNYAVGDFHTDDQVSYQFKNVRKVVLTDFQFHQIWMDNGTDGRPNAQMYLFRSIGGSDPVEITNAQRVWNTQQSDWHWTCGFDGLPKYDEQGALYTYYVTGGLSTQGDYVMYYSGRTPDSDNHFVLEEADKTVPHASQGGTVVYRREGSYSISGTKTWMNVPGSLESLDYPTAQFDLMTYSYAEDKLSAAGMQLDIQHSIQVTVNGSLVTAYVSNGGTSFDYSSYGELDRYDALGREIPYFIKENPINGYAELEGKIGQFVLSNVYAPDQSYSFNLLATKKFSGWPTVPDAGHYPEITLELWREIVNKDGAALYKAEFVKRVKLTVTGEETVFDFGEAPVYAPNALPYRYTIRERTIDGYVDYATGEGEESYLVIKEIGSLPDNAQSNRLVETEVENTYTGGAKRTVTVNAEWLEDEENRYKTRPDQITVHLYRWDGAGDQPAADRLPAPYQTKTVITPAASGDGWTAVFTDLETFAPNGRRYSYYVKEADVTGYENMTGLVSLTETQQEVTVRNKLQTVTLPVVKQWKIEGRELVSGETSFGLLPDDMRVELTLERRPSGSADTQAWETVLRDGSPAVTMFPIKAAGVEESFSYRSGAYHYTYRGLPRYEKTSGLEYTYRVRETGLDSPSKSGGRIETVGTQVGPYEIGYETGVDGTVTITNTITDAVYLYIQTTWDDGDNQDGIRPASLVYSIIGKEFGSADQNGKAAVTVKKPSASEVPAGEAGKTSWAVYSISFPAKSLQMNTIAYEDGTSSAAGYTPALTDKTSYTAPGQKAGTLYRFMFTHVPKRLTIRVEKSWELYGQPDAYKRSVYAKLNRRVGSQPETGAAVPLIALAADTVPEAWKGEWSDLPAAENTTYVNTASTGASSRLTYTVLEVDAAGDPLDQNRLEGFLEPVYGGGDGGAGSFTAPASALTGSNPLAADLVIKNKLDMTTYQVTQNWEDSADLYKTRPSEADGSTKTTYQIQRRKEGEAAFVDFGAEQKTLVTEKKGVTKSGVLWSQLPKYAPDGVLYEYRITEIGIGAYGTDADGTAGYNYLISYERNQAYEEKVTNQIQKIEGEKVRFSVSKVWEDDGNRDGKRPLSLSVKLSRDGVLVDTAVLTAAKNWSYTWEGLPKYKNGGSDLSVYTVQEIPPNTAGYSPDETKGGVDGQARSEHDVVFTNVYNPHLLNIHAKSVWHNDDGYAEETRPASVLLTLQKYDTSANVWKNCTADDTADPAAAFQNPIRLSAPDSVQAEWPYGAWNQLYQYQGGGKLRYRVVQNEAPGYKTTAEAELSFTTDKDHPVLDITTEIQNTLYTVTVTADKQWEDLNDKNRLRPGEVYVQLYRQAASDQTAIATDVPVKLEGPSWSYRFDRLLRYKPQTSEEYTYNLREVKDAQGTALDRVDGTEMMLGYRVSYGGGGLALTVKNTLPVISHRVEISWDDEEDLFSIRPDKVTVQLERRKAGSPNWEAAGVDKKEISGDASGNWTAVWDNLPLYAPDNQKYVYRAVQTKVGDFPVDARAFGGGYRISGLVSETVTALKDSMDRVEVFGTILWEDKENLYQIRPKPESLLVTCYRDGTALNASVVPVWETGEINGWKYRYQNLPRWTVTNGVLALSEYHLEEHVPVGYLSPLPKTPVAAASENSSVVALDPIVNRVSVVSISGSVEWTDDNDEWGVRPKGGNELELEVFADGAAVSVSSSQITWNGWGYQIQGLPRYSPGKEIIDYTVQLKDVRRYDIASSGVSQSDAHGNITGVDFMGELRTGSLVITNEIAGNVDTALLENQEFTYELVFDHAGRKDGVYDGGFIHSAGGIEYPAGPGTPIVLKDQESVRLEGIPEFVTYRVTETPLPGFAVTSTGDQGEISNQGRETAAFINTVADTQLEMTNKTPQETGMIGGKIAVGVDESSLNPDGQSTDTAVNGIAAAWEPDQYWAFDDKVTVSWYNLGDPSLYTVTVTGYVREDGSIDPSAFDVLKVHGWIQAEATVSDNGSIVLKLQNDSGRMPAVTQVEVSFLPTFAVLNLTEEQSGSKGGAVGFDEETKGEEKGAGTPRSVKKRMFAEAEDGYYVQMKNITVGMPQTLENDGGATVNTDDSGHFTVTIPAEAGRTKNLTEPITVTGDLVVTQQDKSGNPEKIELVLDASIPLDVGIRFEKRSVSGGGGGTGGRPGNSQTPAAAGGPGAVPAVEPETVPETVEPGNPDQETSDPKSRLGEDDVPHAGLRNLPRTSDSATGRLILYAAGWLVSGGASALCLTRWRRRRKNGKPGDRDA